MVQCSHDVVDRIGCSKLREIYPTDMPILPSPLSIVYQVVCALHGRGSGEVQICKLPFCQWSVMQQKRFFFGGGGKGGGGVTQLEPSMISISRYKIAEIFSSL